MELGLIPVIPLGFAFFLPPVAFLTGKKRRFMLIYALIALTATFLSSLWLFEKTYSSNTPLVYAFGNWVAPIGIVFEVDRLSANIILTVTFGFLMAGIYSMRFLDNSHGLDFFYTFFLGLEAGVIGAFMTGDAFNLFVMLEVIGASAYAIVGFYRNRSKAIEGAFKYGISGAVATSLYFLALGFLYASFGTVNMANLSAEFHGISFPVTTRVFGDPALALAFFFALTIAMVLIKSAIFPGHYWLPDAYQGAPIPVGAVMSGFVEIVGIYSLMRFIYTIFQGFPSEILSLTFFILGSATAFLGSIMMTVQKDVKRIIAYSTILHMGYLFMTVGAGTQLALLAINFHMVNHAIAKMLLFFTVGTFTYKSRSTELDSLAGIGRGMPLTTALFGIATLSLVGVPPLNVFFSKMLIFDALLQVSPVLASVVIITSAIAAWAYFRLFIIIWRGKSPASQEEIPASMTFTSLLLGILVIILGLLAPLLIDIYFYPATLQAMNYRAYIEAVKMLVG